MYAYTKNNPVMMVDPSGYSPWSWLEDRWNELNDWFNEVPEYSFTIPSSSEIISTLSNIMVGGSTTVIAQTLISKDLSPADWYLRKGWFTPPNLTKIGDKFNRFADGLMYVTATLDIANTWFSNNDNTNLQRLEKTGIQIAGIYADMAIASAGIAMIGIGLGGSVPSFGASLALVGGGGAVIVGGTYGVYQAQKAIYDALGID